MSNNENRLGTEISRLFNKYHLYFYFALAFLLTWWVKDNFFFWDTVQFASIHPQFYFENGFSQFFLPESMDSGHPPTFGMYIAAMWKLFGKSLAVSHFAMLPFLFGIIWASHKLGKQFFKDSWVPWFMAIVLIDPVLAGQSVLVTPDLFLVFSFLLSLVGIFSQKRIYLSLGIIGLCIISTRGMMTTAALFLFEILNRFLIQKNKLTIKELINLASPYIIGGLLGFSFLIGHCLHAGWIGYHENSPWAPSFERVGAAGVLKNVAVLIWRFLDFGRIGICCGVLFLFGFIFRNKMKLNTRTKQILLLFFCLFMFLSPTSILHKMLLGHRYMLPMFIVLTVLFFHLMHDYLKTIKWQRIIFSTIFILLFTGNFWVYPKKISQGWDSTLASLPYYDLRLKMIKYIDDQKIPFSEIGSAFPNIKSLSLIDLSDDNRSFVEKDLDQNKFVFYSNVFNDFSDSEIDDLQNNWTIEKSFQKNNICVILYKR